MHEFEALRRRFNFGDLVKVDDEPDRIYQIVGYQVSIYFSPGKTDKDLMYDLADIVTGDIVMPAIDEELELVVSADQADAFISNRQRDEQPKSDDMHIVIDLSNRSDRELVDMILDKYNDYMAASSDLKGVAPTAAVRSWKKDAKEMLNELRELIGGDGD